MDKSNAVEIRLPAAVLHQPRPSAEALGMLVIAAAQREPLATSRVAALFSERGLGRLRRERILDELIAAGLCRREGQKGTKRGRVFAESVYHFLSTED